MKKLVTMIVLLQMISANVDAWADVSVRKRAVDVVQLTDGTLLFGVMLDASQEDLLRVMFRRSWLQANAPKMYEMAKDTVKSRPGQAGNTKEKLRRHIDDLQTAANPSLERIGYLEERLIALFPDEAAEREADIVILKFSADLIRQKILKSKSSRQIAGLAVLNDVDIAETGGPIDLNERLTALDADKMIRTLPATDATEDPDKLLNLILLRADRLFGTTSRLIHLNGQFISDNEKTQNLEALAAQMLTGQVQNQLQQLLGDEFAVGKPQQPQNGELRGNELPQAAVRIAEREQAEVVEVSTMDLDALSGTARVSIGVYHRKSGEPAWKKVSAVTAVANQRDVSPENQQKIADDPRVKQVAEIFSALGAGGNELSKALSIGAAVEVAQKRANVMVEEALSLEPKGSNQVTVLESQISDLPAQP